MTSLSLDEFRARFPLVAARTYLNNCSQGALSRDVEEAMTAYLRSWHDEGSPWEAWVSVVEQLRAAFARMVGASSDEIAVMPSASAGINAVASALDFGGPRNRLVAGEFEFPTMGQIWIAQERRGAHVVWARANDDELPVASYSEAIDDRTLLVCCTRVCYKNGFRTDVEGVTRLCRERGAYMFLDDYQFTGSGRTDVRELGVDFMVTGSLKYLLGPSGVAFLYVRRELIERLEPTVTGWFGRVNPFDFRPDRLDWSPSARRFECGTPPVPNAYGALAGIELLQRVGLQAVEEQVASLAGRAIRRAHEARYAVLTAEDPRKRGPLVVIRSRNAQDLVARLMRRGVITSARGSGVRLSFHAYNTADDVDRAFAALAAEKPLLESASRSSLV
jgi:selenocysteine lyase/cysteine desulfurase